jgi:glycosyltransferase involved in cell wall biosynthesis
MKTLVIIPAYNEEESIETVIRGIDGRYNGVDYLVVNDCSTDGTAALLKKGGYRHLNLPVNLGIGGGVQSGYRYAVENGYDIAIQMDGDGQHDPTFIPDLIEPIEKGEADMVIGSRFIEKKGFQTSSLRRFGIRWIRGVIRLCCGIRVTDTTSGFRACSKELTKYFSENYAQDYPEPEAIVSAALRGFRIAEVPVVMNERMGGESSIGGLKSAYYMIKVTIALLIYRLGGKGGHK